METDLASEAVLDLVLGEDVPLESHSCHGAVTACYNNPGMKGMNEAPDGGAVPIGGPSGSVIMDCSGWREIYYYEGESIYMCCICGAGLGPDPEDEPHAEGRGRHLCGACNRTKNFEAMVGSE